MDGERITDDTRIREGALRKPSTRCEMKRAVRFNEPHSERRKGPIRSIRSIPPAKSLA